MWQQRCAFESRGNDWDGGACREFPESAALLRAQVLERWLVRRLVWLHFLRTGNETAEKEVKLSCFCTGPAIRARYQTFLSETIATFVWCLSWARFFPKAVAAGGLANGVGPY